MSSDAPVAEAFQAPAAEVGYKAFVGNLAFSTTGEDLKSVFGAVGEISNAQVINRGTRSLGYGFVTFSSEADAIKAVSQLDKSELAGRQINVELAKPPTASAAGRIPKAAAKAAIQQGATEGEEIADGEAKPKKSKSKKRAPKGRRPRTDGETEEAGDAPAVDDVSAKLAATNLNEDGSASAPAPKKRAPRRKAAAATNPDGTPAAPSSAPARRGPPTGEPSKTLLFVANLPFSVTDEGLGKVFEGYKVASARVVTKKFGPSEGKSKGFGFVDFASEEEQQKALNGCQGKEVDGREIQLKVAIQEEKKEEQAANGDAAAPKVSESLKEAESTIIAS